MRKILLFSAFLFSLFFVFLTFFPSKTYAACGSYPEGAQRCVLPGTYEQCTNGTWVSHSCGSGFYCQVVGLNDVSCVAGCSQRGLTCTTDSICKGEGGKVWPTYYCSSGVCCQFTTIKYACINGACQQSSTGTFTESTCGGTCAPAPPSGGGGYNCETRRCVANTSNTPGTYPDAATCRASGCEPGGTSNGCPVCSATYTWSYSKKKCIRYAGGGVTTEQTPTWQTCSSTQLCSPGCGCNCTLPKGFTSGSLPCDEKTNTCYTAFGPIRLDPASLVKDFFGIVLSISGGIAVLLIILSGYRLIASQGNPEKIQEAQERLTAAIVGLLFVIFSFSILKFIGVDVLGIFP